MPLLTTQSAKGYGLTSSVVAAADTDYVSIQTHALTSATTSITFSSIPSTYKHLQIRGMYLTSAQYPDGLRIRINGDGTANKYNANYMYNTGSGASTSISDTSSNYILAAGNRGNTTFPSVFLCDFNDYTSTSKLKSGHIMQGLAIDNADRISLMASFSFESTSAISSIELYVATGNINANSHFALYGINA